MAITNSEKEVKDCIELLGLNVKKIKEGSEKGPDFLVQCDRFTYLIELKEKFADPKIQKAWEARLLQGEIVEDIFQQDEESSYRRLFGMRVNSLAPVK